MVMSIYIIVFLIFFIMMFLYCHTNYNLDNSKQSIRFKINDTFLLLLSSLPIALLSAFRYGFGPDYNGTYKYIFNTLHYNTNSSIKNLEIGFAAINKIVGLFTKDYVYLLMVVALITIISIFFCLRKNTKCFGLSIFLFIIIGLYFESMCAVRQFLAIPFFIISLKYIYQKKFYKYLLCLLFGSLFHTSILFLIPLYFLYDIKLNFTKVLFIFIFLWIGSSYLFEVIKDIIEYTPQYSKYLSTISDKADPEISLIIVFAISSIISYFTRNKDKKLNFFFNSMIMGLTLSILCTNIGYLERFLLYFKIIVVIFLPYSLKMFSINKYKKMISFSIYLILFFYFIYTTFIVNWYGAVPYVSIFNR